MRPIKLGVRLLLIVATVAGAVVAYWVWQWQKHESVDARYSAALAQLLQPRKDGEPDAASQVHLLRELAELIDNKSEGDPAMRQKLRGEVTDNLTALFKSHSFDLSQGANVEFETMALTNWTEYADHLSSTPEDNVWIMYQYSLALRSLGQKEPAIIRSALQQADGSMTHSGEVRDKNAAALMQKLNGGYRLHLGLLRKVPAEVNKKYLLTSFCWYRDAINNLSLTEYVFSYDETQVRAEVLRCREAGQSVKDLD
jgi:hypothetical protein